MFGIATSLGLGVLQINAGFFLSVTTRIANRSGNFFVVHRRGTGAITKMFGIRLQIIKNVLEASKVLIV